MCLRCIYRPGRNPWEVTHSLARVLQKNVTVLARTAVALNKRVGGIVAHILVVGGTAALLLVCPMDRHRWLRALFYLTCALGGSLLVPTLPAAERASTGDVAAPGPEDEDTQLYRVAAWNVEWFPGMKVLPSLDAEAQHEKDLAQALPGLEADVLCLQEVVSARALQRTLGSVPGYRLNVISDFADAPQEMAIVSRFKAVESGAVPYTAAGPVQPPRGFSWAALDVGEGDLLLVYSVHFKSNRGEAQENYAMREEAAVQLTRHMQETVARLKGDGAQRRVAAVVAGDFNTDPQNGKWEGDGTWNVFAKAGLKWTWEGVPEDQRLSWLGNDKFEATCFDHVLLWQLDGMAGSKAELLTPSLKISDHRPVAVTLTW